ncbi:hypothetical protein THAOC_06500, partial [Thalassiosira oceanica]
ITSTLDTRARAAVQALLASRPRGKEDASFLGARMTQLVTIGREWRTEAYSVVSGRMLGQQRERSCPGKGESQGRSRRQKKANSNESMSLFTVEFYRKAAMEGHVLAPKMGAQDFSYDDHLTKAEPPLDDEGEAEDGPSHTTHSPLFCCKIAGLGRRFEPCLTCPSVAETAPPGEVTEPHLSSAPCRLVVSEGRWKRKNEEEKSCPQRSLRSVSTQTPRELIKQAEGSRVPRVVTSCQSSGLFFLDVGDQIHSLQSVEEDEAKTDGTPPWHDGRPRLRRRPFGPAGDVRRGPSRPVVRLRGRPLARQRDRPR